MVDIRRATIFDHSEVLSLLIEWFDESQIIKGYDEAACTWVSNMITNHLVLVAEYEDRIIGVMGLRITQMPWNSKDYYIISDFIMVDKDYRTFGAAHNLLKSAKETADKAEMILLIGNNNGDNVELKDRYFSMQGFKYLGGNFSYCGGM